MSEVKVGRFRFCYNDPHDVIGIVETAVFDVYERSLIEAGSTLIDIGAGIGDFAVIASQASGPKGKVVAIEPSPSDFACLTENLRVNNCANVRAVNCAIGSRPGSATLSFKDRQYLCSIRRLRDVLDDLNVDPFSVKHAKIDVEGMEEEIVPANIDVLAHCRSVSIELHGEPGRSAQTVLERAGLHFERVKRGQYLRRTSSFLLRHPLQSTAIYSALRNAEGYHGIRKFLGGIDIASSSTLAVGVYVR